jgi:hypothetical protein
VSDTYTKLFSSITESTVWGEPYATRIVWVAMLAMADKGGCVYGSIPGLARRANVTLGEVETAMASFRSPDPYSRTQADDGRRIEDIDGGWRLVNHGKYAAVRNAEERREYQREWDRKHRNKSVSESDKSDKSDKNPTNTTSPTPPTPTPTLEDQPLSSSADADDPPAEFGSHDLQTRLATVAAEAIATFNASPLVKAHGGVLASVSAKVGKEKRKGQVRRCLRTARQICDEAYGSPMVTARFWADYWAEVAADPFHSGRQGGGKGHENWVPDFEFLTKEVTMLRVYDRTVSEAAA